MAKNKKIGEDGRTKFENREDKRNFFDQFIFDDFLQSHFEGKNKNSAHKL